MKRVSGLGEQKHLDLVALGAVIRQVRKEKGLSQEALADYADIDRSHMGKIERGERNVTALNLLKIAAALETKLWMLMQRAGC